LACKTEKSKLDVIISRFSEICHHKAVSMNNLFILSFYPAIICVLSVCGSFCHLLSICLSSSLDSSNHELNKQVSRFSPLVIQVFHSYSWPGNIREMKNVIKRAVLLCTEDEINEDHLPSEILYQPDSLKQATSGDLRKQTEYQEREIILSTLEKTRYNKSKAAELLSIDRKTLYNKMKQYGIES